MPLSADPDLEHVADQLAADEHVRRRTWSDVLHRVADHVGEQLPDQGAVGEHLTQRAVLDHRSYVGVRLAHALGDLLDHAGQRQRGRRQRRALGLRVGQQVGDELLHPVLPRSRCGAGSTCGADTSTLQGVELVAEDLRPAADAGQRRLQVVRDRPGERLELAAVGAFLGDVVDRRRPPSSRRRPGPSDAAAARPTERVACCPVPGSMRRMSSAGTCLAAQGAGVRHLVALDRRNRPAGRCRSRRDRPRPGCRRGPINRLGRRVAHHHLARALDHDQAVGHHVHHRVEELGARRGPRLGLGDPCVQRGPLADAEGEQQHQHRGHHHVDLRPRSRAWSRSSIGAERSTSRLRPEHRQGREDQRVDGADSGGEPVADPGRCHDHHVARSAAPRSLPNSTAAAQHREPRPADELELPVRTRLRDQERVPAASGVCPEDARSAGRARPPPRRRCCRCCAPPSRSVVSQVTAAGRQVHGHQAGTALVRAAATRRRHRDLRGRAGSRHAARAAGPRTDRCSSERADRRGR